MRPSGRTTDALRPGSIEDANDDAPNWIVGGGQPLAHKAAL